MIALQRCGPTSMDKHLVAWELNDPICHSDECQIGSFSSEATIYGGWSANILNIIVECESPHSCKSQVFSYCQYYYVTML